MLKEASERDPMYKFLDPGMLGNIYLPLVGGLTPSKELRVESMNSAKAAE